MPESRQHRAGRPATGRRPVARVVFAATLAAVLLVPGAARAQTSVVKGRIVSAATGEPVEFAQLLLGEVHRSTMSNAKGEFVLRFVPAGVYTLRAYRVGFEMLEQTVIVLPDDTLDLTLEMRTSVLVFGEVVVEGARTGQEVEGAVMQIEGSALRASLGTTIAETLDREPGLAMRSMGPAPARPVLRGLGGERLLVLEDGGRTGDLSQTSTDHALVIDPITANRIEVIRGPAALAFGPNTLAGAINVVREQVPTARPEALHVVLTTQGQSVNRGLAGGAALTAPVGPSLSFRADGSYRAGGDVRTPEGSLGNTDLSTGSGSAGVSLVRPWGYAGLSAAAYRSSYGIPGGFVGAHPNGVSVEVDRRHVEARADVVRPLPGISHLEVQGAWTRYHHEEYESNGALGIEFGLVTGTARLTAHTHRRGPLEKGAFGVWTEYRDYASGGFSSTPATTEWTVAGFAYQDLHVGPVALQGGLRYDARRVTPSEERTSSIGRIRPRDYGGVSASLALQWPREGTWALGATVMRSLRLPGIEELYSEGPHLAAYSFEVGSPDLGLERGLGFELTGRYGSRRLEASVAAFLNRMDGYIYPRNTGELNYRVYLPIYQFSGARARMVGGEGRVRVNASASWYVEGTSSFVHGELTDRDEPIPWMPPLRGSLTVGRERGPLALSATLRGAVRQERLGAFEEPTAGHVTLDVSAEYYFALRGFLHTVTLGVENATDTAYRDHLSRVKSIMPEPGRNLKFLYKVFF